MFYSKRFQGCVAHPMAVQSSRIVENSCVKLHRSSGKSVNQHFFFLFFLRPKGQRPPGPSVNSETVIHCGNERKTDLKALWPFHKRHFFTHIFYKVGSKT